MRIGLGYDAHRFKEGIPLIIGGVEIPYEKGLNGHSDADVLVHAIMDALLGAANLGDLGDHFPESDKRYKGISSIELLKYVGAVLYRNDFIIENIDTVIIAQEPLMAPHRPGMVKQIAAALDIPEKKVSIKATTEEWLGFTGKKEGIAAQAVVLLKEGA